MKLSKTDKEILLSLGDREEDFAQIEEAISKTKYTMNDDASENETKISAKKAREILGNESFLSGLSRSAFHFSAIRYNYETGKRVSFDSSALFKCI